jgi:vacuolar protein sorting-associated protein 35
LKSNYDLNPASTISVLLQMHEGKRVLECLRKAVKVATECLDPGVQAQLLVELINAYDHFYHRGNQQVT